MVESEEFFAEEDEYHLSNRRRVSEIYCELRAFCTDAAVIGSDRELTSEVIDRIIIQRDSQLQFDSHPSFAVAEIPYTFAKNSIHHRSDFVLCAPYGIVVSHSIRYSVLR